MLASLIHVHLLIFLSIRFLPLLLHSPALLTFFFFPFRSLFSSHLLSCTSSSTDLFLRTLPHPKRRQRKLCTNLNLFLHAIPYVPLSLSTTNTWSNFIYSPRIPIAFTKITLSSEKATTHPFLYTRGSPRHEDHSGSSRALSTHQLHLCF